MDINDNAEWSTQMQRCFRNLVKKKDGATAVEFALAFPVVIAMTMGIVEIGYISFAESTLEGAVRDASRAGVTNFAPTGMTREEFVHGQIEKFMENFHLVDTDGTGGIEIETVVYDSFSDIGEPEPFIDSPPVNGMYDEGECFTDVNGNGAWDSDMGAAGLGESGGVVVYRANVDLVLLTPVFRYLIDRESGSIRLSAATAVRNEPFSQTQQDLKGNAGQLGGCT